MRLGCRGYNSKEIGEKLFVSQETIKSRKRNIAVKLHTRNFTHAIATVCLLTPELIIPDAEAQVE